MASPSQMEGTRITPLLGAGAGTPGEQGAVPGAGADQQDYLLTGDAVWKDPFAIATGLSSTKVSSLATIATTSLTAVLVDDTVGPMTLTPGAGTYRVSFSASCSHNKNGAQVVAAIYANGSEVASSQRRIGGQAGNIGQVKLEDEVTVADGQAIEIRWFITSNSGGGTGTMLRHTMFVTRVG